MLASNAKRNSQLKSHQRNCLKFLRLFAETCIPIFKNMLQLLMRVYIDNLMMTKSLFILKKMLNGLVFMTDTEEPSVLSSSSRNFMSTSLTPIGEKMCLQLWEKPLLRQTTNGKRKEIIVAVVLLLFSCIIISVTQPISEILGLFLLANSSINAIKSAKTINLQILINKRELSKLVERFIKLQLLHRFQMVPMTWL